MPSNLYLIERNDVWSYDEYDSAVVVADTEEEAKATHPDQDKVWDGDKGVWYSYYGLATPTRYDELSSSWVPPSSVTATYLGEAESSRLSGEVICASFNAG